MIHILACPACANAFEEAGGDAIGWAIFLLLVVIVAILSGVGSLMFKMIRNERSNLDPSHMDETIPS